MDNKADLQALVNDFYPYAKKRLGFEKDPEIFLKDDPQNAEEPLGKTAFYEPERMSITLYTSGRHLKDISRSLSHELVHHMQNCRGDFDKKMPTGEGYAQEDEHLREMERQAYEQGNLIFRDFEDQVKKQEPVMESNTKEVERQIRDAKKNRGKNSPTREVQEDISNVISDRNTKVNDELMRRWGFNKNKGNK